MSAEPDFPVSRCARCEREVLTHLHLDDAGGEHRLCFHCDAEIDPDARVTVRMDSRLVVEQMFSAIVKLKEDTGIGILLAEQNAGVVEIIDTFVLMQSGEITESRPVEQADVDGIAKYMFGQ